jgi:hypothetical protein
MPLPLRYTVRKEQEARRYSVWDNEQNRLASFNGQECTGLDFHSAFHAADELNAQSIQPKEQ